MDIALIGVPGSGKSGLAHQLLNHITEHHGSCRNIDGYADEVGEVSHLALGEWAGYIGNLLVASARLTDEIAAMKNKDVEHSIVCGTLVETITYMSIHAAVFTGKDPEEQQKIQMFMHLMGCLMHDMFIYDHIFYLPPGDDATREQVTVDEELRRALSLYSIDYATLDGPVEDKLEKALTIIEPTKTPE